MEVAEVESLAGDWSKQLFKYLQESREESQAKCLFKSVSFIHVETRSSFELNSFNRTYQLFMQIWAFFFIAF